MHNLKTKYYFIDNFETKNIDKVDKQTILIYRNYLKKNKDEKILLKIKKYCKKKGLKFYLANNIRLALKLKLDGAYIPSFNKELGHLSFNFHKKFKLIGSAHNLKEIKIKELQGVEKIFLSSLFKKNKNFLGINRFKLLANLTNKTVVILGGVSAENINKLRLFKYSDFAGISYFE